MGKYDVFFGCQQSEQYAHYASGATISGAQVLKAEGTAFAMTATPSAAYTVGEVMKLVGGGKTAYCTLAAKPNSTTFVLRPNQTIDDTAGAIGFNFPNGSTVTKDQGVQESPGRLIIDLSDAPEDTYKYLIIAVASLSKSAASRARIQLQRNARAGDSRSGTSVNICDVDPPVGGTDEFVVWNSVIESSVPGGQRSEFYIQHGPWNADASSVKYAFLMAIRVDNAAYYKCANNVNANSFNAVNLNTVTEDVNSRCTPSGEAGIGAYLMIATAGAQVDTGGNGVEIELRVGGVGGSTGHLAQFKPKTAGDTVSVGVCRVISLQPTDYISWWVKNLSGGTASGRLAFCALIRIDTLPDHIMAVLSDSKTTPQTLTTPAAFTDFGTHTSASKTIEEGPSIEFISSLSGPASLTQYFHVRPWFDADAYGLYPDDEGPRGVGGSKLAFSTTQAGLMNFWFFRRRRVAGATTNKIQGRWRGGAINVKQYRTDYIWIREFELGRITERTKTTIIADIERGFNLKNWLTYTYADSFYKNLPANVFNVSRVLLNLEPLTQVKLVTDLASTTSAWHWEPTTKQITICLESGISPSDIDAVITVCAIDSFGREHADIVVGDDYVPYDSRIQDAPSIEQELEIRGEGAKVATQDATITLINQDGLFDEWWATQNYEGLEAKIWRGWKQLSDKRSSFELISRSTQTQAARDLETFSLTLLDQVPKLDRPICTVKQDVYQGASLIPDVVMPEIFGLHRRIVAQRIQNNLGTSATNLYMICGKPLLASAVTAAYKSATGPAISISSQDTANAGGARITINNNQFGLGATDEPPDTIFVDVTGYGGLTAPGDILQALLSVFGKVLSTDLALSSFRLLDREWRWKLDVDQNIFVPTPLACGLYATSEMAVIDGVDMMCRTAACFMKTNRAGRLKVEVWDNPAVDIVENGSFEDATLFPWVAVGGGSVQPSTTLKYVGARSMEITATSTQGVTTYVDMPRAGLWAATAMIAVRAGASNQFRFGLNTPGDAAVMKLSDAIGTGSARWRRVSAVFEVPEGETGRATLTVWPAKAGALTTIMNIDVVELIPVDLVVQDSNVLPEQMEFAEESYYEVHVPFNVNQQVPENSPKASLNDQQSLLLGIGTVSQAESTLATSAVLLLDDILLDDAYSAFAVCSYYVDYLSLQRQNITLKFVNYKYTPMVGSRVYLDFAQLTRIPLGTDPYPIALLNRVTTQDQANVVECVAERPTEAIYDRREIRESQVPLGTIAFCTGTACPADYDEYTAMRDYFLVNALLVDFASPVGAARHQHEMDHPHVLLSHGHTAKIRDAWSEEADPVYDRMTHEDRFGGTNAQGSKGTTASVGHRHGTGNGLFTMGSTTGQSDIADIISKWGSNLVKHKMALFCKRTKLDNDAIPTTLVFGYDGATPPSPWGLCDGTGGRPDLQGRAIKCGYPSGAAVNTTSKTAAYVPADAGAVINLNSASNVHWCQRLTVVDGAKVSHGFVTNVAGTAITLVPLHEPGDSVDGTSFAIGCTVTAASCVSGQDFDSGQATETQKIPNHAHGGTGPSHTHKARHVHQGIVANPPSITNDGFYQDDRKEDSLYPEISAPSHEHEFVPQFPEDATNSAAASDTITESRQNTPPSFRMPFIQATGAVTILSVGMILWVDAASCPDGYDHYSGPDDLLLVGQTAGLGPGVDTSGHDHDMTAAEHDYPHDHGDTYQDVLGEVINDIPYRQKGGIVRNEYVVSLEHDHDVVIDTINNGNADVGGGNPKLVAASIATKVAQGSTLLPYGMRLQACRKS